METLPLFPLNTVLFPGTPLRLHIFEERYKRMIARCLEGDTHFGVVLIKRGTEALGPPTDPYPVGCTAQILRVQRLQEGRMNIATLGKERFQIKSLDWRSELYLQGSVESFPLIRSEPKIFRQLGQRMHNLVEHYLDTLERAGVIQVDRQVLPGDLVDYAYFASALLDIPNEQKQEVLSIESEEELLRKVIRIYKREKAFLSVFLKRGYDSGAGITLN